MNRIMRLAGALLVFGVVQTAHAQYVPPQVSPYGNQSYSPYLNMLRQGNPAVNYMGLVQPQMQAQSNFQQLQGDINARSAFPGVAPPRNSGVADTGYSAARFMQYQQYFLTLPTGGGVNYRTPAGTMSSGSTSSGTTAATFGRR